MVAEGPDEVIGRLACLFRGHPAWVEAARDLAPEARAGVYFSHRPREAWHLEQRQGVTLLLPGAAIDPDFVFRFTPGSIERLESVRGGIGDFAVELFGLVLEEDPDLRVGLRIVAPFPRLWRRGYVRLLLDAGARVAAFGAAHGVRTLAALRRLVVRLRQQGPEDWESSP